MDIANIANKNYCHDCGKKIGIEGEEIKNGVLLIYEDNGDKINIFKCNGCFKNKPGLTNYKQCEIYSRVVGYLRPVQQWNIGKKTEYSERKEYAAQI
ncbi:MAG: hypothetical protein A2626_03425 [Candidatus Nealsonbacteria bacterium RIFCSPHIGHO2_01_FULL_38_55]|uniref:Uncharacterized protein n=2 Tax=Candidatus Nealsoniibacteriota TaxID=1817911 RepID=A0A1G2EIA9_9BACT|nr:MAG: Anaerobic ribonucleoside-triphosphate reductase [Parcubacteria group bacterium GW2011_GWA2_38_27]KKQ97602.1 MAG: Anaerobic ribonucleoside-triphosphate reductase [Parcubacteria group bacterium GW2011_GWC2_39_11]OGZ19519.1 MAG: hypothetical protein A2626_03425 [Candidatus Nealsonbacteria bacterium RIFCSPHIGHO2_01_FULL_38_55]OGZ21579.1 MAG: hypothetical protein A3C48_00215 [Candidatus Nealsonbacteria bacterium RIFCSPHIGHO2_02_FULL_38_75]OGZ21778.1 MAG: hypothetical protein A2W55_01365 [Can